MPNRVRLDDGWHLTTTPAGAAATPGAIDGPWHPATVPGTVAEVLGPAVRWHDHDVWYRRAMPGPGVLAFGGLATVCEIWADETPLLRSETMFASHRIATQPGLLYLCFRGLKPALAAVAQRAWPRARWRTGLVADRRLRLVRTTLLGHLPDWCPPVDAVGPWRPVTFVPTGAVALTDQRVTARLYGADGVVAVRIALDGPVSAVALQVGDGAPVPLAWDGAVAAGEVTVPAPARWWPHTHGTPTLHALTLHIDGRAFPLAPVGFRTIAFDGMHLRVNGVPVFCRGAVWITPDLVRLGGDPGPRLRAVQAVGMNMLRVSGVGHYQDRAFHEGCDALGILVWQDLMLASQDYPVTDPAFAATVSAEIGWALGPLAASPSLAVVCGGSEVAQQAAMMGLPATTWRDPFYTDTLLAVVAAIVDVPYVPNSPWGDGWPFAPDQGGPTHYFGVGAYRRPLHDAETAGVRFASECLAFAHVPDGRTADPWASPPRDPGAAWDFADVRDHYTAVLFGTDPAALRLADPDRALLLARATSVVLLQEVVAGWRCTGQTHGALVWHLADFAPGAGWGILDAAGRPKPAWHGLRQASAPLLLVLRDQGLSGLGACIVNDGAVPVVATLRVRCLRDGAIVVAEADLPLHVPAHDRLTLAPATLFPRFFDVTYAYRFGPPEHDVTTAWLEADGHVLATAQHFPRGRAALGPAVLGAVLVAAGDGWAIDLTTDRYAACVHISDGAWSAPKDWFDLVPGQPRRVGLRADDGRVPPAATVRALNAAPVSCRSPSTATHPAYVPTAVLDRPGTGSS